MPDSSNNSNTPVGAMAPDASTSPVALRFVNSDARPKVAEVSCAPESIAQIMAWYAAYYAGDRYTVYADGEKLLKDRNGELVAATPPAPEVSHVE